MAEPYSDAFLADGPLLFVSGQVPEGPDGDIALDVTGQTRRILQNMTQVLGRYGADLGHVVQMTHYLKHISDLDEFTDALLDHLPQGHRPAATLVEVSGLPNPRYLVQIEAVARPPRGAV